MGGGGGGVPNIAASKITLSNNKQRNKFKFNFEASGLSHMFYSLENLK